MRHLRGGLPLALLLLSGSASLPAGPPLALPGIPDFRLPSAGVVDTLFPLATGGAAPYTYSLSGQPPGIRFFAGTRKARGTLPTVPVETTYTVRYSVRDGTGSTASVTFTATVVPPLRRGVPVRRGSGWRSRPRRTVPDGPIGSRWLPGRR